MKQIPFFLYMLLTLTSCTQSAYDYKTENLILDCFYQHHIDNGLDIKTTIDEVERVLLKHGILENNAGESYIQVIEQIRDNNHFEINNPNLIADINTIENIPSSVFCRDSSYAFELDSASVANSRLTYVIGIFDSIRIKGTISPSLVAEEILEVFDAHDFENEYYKTLGLVMFATLVKMSDSKNGLLRRLPHLPDVEEIEIEEAHNILEVLVNKENQILVDGEIVDISELTDWVKAFILESADKKEKEFPIIGKQMASEAVISLKTERGASYARYIAVHNELVRAYNEIWNAYAIKFFGSNYEDLSDGQREIIKDFAPRKISEAEPGP